MKVLHYLVFIFFLYSCSFERTPDNYQSELSTQNDSGNSAKPDTSIQLIIVSDTAYFKKGSVLLKKSYIRPLTIIGGDRTNPKEHYDEVFLVANCMVILKDIKTAGHFSHVPEVGSVEIYSAEGNSAIIKASQLKSKGLDGFDFTSNFLGNKFSSKNGNWGVINIEAEGELLGCIIIRSDATVKEIVFDGLYLTGEIYEAEFSVDDKLIWKKILNDAVSINFMIDSVGNFNVINTP